MSMRATLYATFSRYTMLMMQAILSFHVKGTCIHALSILNQRAAFPNTTPYKEITGCCITTPVLSKLCIIYSTVDVWCCVLCIHDYNVCAAMHITN